MPEDKCSIAKPDKGGQTHCCSDSTCTEGMSHVDDSSNVRSRQSSLIGRIGILGGIGPESTVMYYQSLIREHYRQHGNLHYPEILILSVSYQDYAEFLCRGQWTVVIAKVVHAIASLKKAGAQYGLIACNALHIVFDEIRNRSAIPLISIVEATCESIERQRMKTVGLLGTALTMNSGIYRKHLMARGIETLVPSEEDKRFVDEVIRKELIRGIIRAKSKGRFMQIIDDLGSIGAEGVILGCTEIPLLIKQHECQIRLFDTAMIHVQKALTYSRALLP